MSTQSRNRSVKRAAPEPPGVKSQEGTTKTDNRQSGSGLSPVSPDIPNGFCKQTEGGTTNFDNTLSSEKQSNNNMSFSHTVSVEKTDCASSPIHIPSKTESKNINQSTAITTDCATSPFPSPTKSTAETRELKQENQSELIDVSTIPLTPGLGSELIEEVRRNTGLSYEKSIAAVETVLGHLGFRLPELAPVLDRVCHTLLEVCCFCHNCS